MPRAEAISVVVCAHTPERLPTIAALIDVVDSQARDDDERILVVDHHPALLAQARQRWPDWTVVANEGPSGLSGARNTGVDTGSAPIIVFCDDDAVPRPGWLQAWRNVFADPTVALVGGAVHADWIGGRPGWFPEELGWTIGCDYRGMPGDGDVIRNPIGANMGVRRSALITAGAFDTALGRVGSLPAGCEETALGIRIGRDLGAGTVRRALGPAVDHQVPTTRRTWRYQLRRSFHEGRSKAVLAGLVGAGSALSSERSYVVRTVVGGVGRHLRRATAEPAALGRAALLGLATAVTAAGYLTGPRTVRRPRPSADDRPAVPVVDLEIAGDLPGLDLVPAGPVCVLLRHRDLPVSSVLLPATDDRRAQLLTALATLAPALAERVGHGPIAEVVAHALQDAAPVRPVDAGPSISVVICTLGRDPRLVDAVSAVLHQTRTGIELLVVDNDPDSGRVDALLAEVDDPRLRIVRAPVRGLSFARNVGLLEATGDLIAYTDDDALPDRHWIDQLARVFSVDDRIGLVTGLVTAAELRTGHQQLFEEYGAFDKGSRTTQWSRTGTDGLPLPGVPGRRGALYPYGGGEFGSGNNMAFRTGLLRSLGGFDTALGAGTPAMGGEDLEIFGRFIRAGVHLVYTPTALVRHFHRDNEDDLRDQVYGYGVGMSAVVFGAVTSGPGPALRILRGAPAAVRVLLSPSSTKNSRKTTMFPAALTRLELRGYAAGPVRLARSRRRARRAGGRFLTAGTGS